MTKSGVGDAFSATKILKQQTKQPEPTAAETLGLIAALQGGIKSNGSHRKLLQTMGGTQWAEML